MPLKECMIDIPDGWEFVRYGVPKLGEYFMDYGCEPRLANHEFDSEWIIIRPARPALEVGDRVRLTRGGFAFSGRLGRVESIMEGGKARVVFDRDSDGLYRLDHLTKQTRIIDPYTMKTCAKEAVRREFARVVRNGLEHDITDIMNHGVWLKGESGAINYAEAASQLTWANGEAFGVERWEDAE